MNSDSAGGQSQTWLHRFAIFLVFSTFFLVIAGGLVTSTGSGLAVPDWPLSYGQLMPPMVGGVFYEHGHRMVATFVGFLTTILAFWLWRSEERKWVRNVGWIALAAVVVQGVLGGLTVLFLLPDPVSISHATMAQSFFSLTIVIALVTSPAWRKRRAEESFSIGRTRWLAVSSFCAIFVQLVLGALMRHTGSGMAIPDFPLSYGSALPPLNAVELAAANDYRVHQLDLAPVGLQQIWIHFAHRAGAVVASVLIFVTVAHVLRNYKNEPALREPALILIVLLLVQVMLGAMTVWTGKAVEVATAHVAAGALVLAATLVLGLWTFRLYDVPAAHTSVTFVQEATAHS